MGARLRMGMYLFSLSLFSNWWCAYIETFSLKKREFQTSVSQFNLILWWRFSSILFPFACDSCVLKSALINSQAGQMCIILWLTKQYIFQWMVNNQLKVGKNRRSVIICISTYCNQSMQQTLWLRDLARGEQN